MKFTLSWLKDHLDTYAGVQAIADRLTSIGLEVESIEDAGARVKDFTVAEIVSAEKHPNADRLRLCMVDAGDKDPLQIVCGAPNARAGMKSALATVGAKLPGDLFINAARLRGVESQGMLASAKELGLAEASTGILELPDDAPLGAPLREYLGLEDSVLDLAVGANRGDAMSVLGIAREVGALTGKGLKRLRGTPEPVAGRTDTFAVHLDAPASCPTFVGCVIRGVNNRGTSPVWLRERLRRAGVRSISPVVDVTNYVMLDLGQPMHAYDLAKLRGEIRVRNARAGEGMILLDGRSIEASEDVLLITDSEGPVGLAGIMGGQRTAVSTDTTDVFFEGAYFSPQAVIGRARRWGLVTDASQRYERGVDPTLQQRAMNKAVTLLQSFAGGSAGPVIVTQSAEHQPTRKPVSLRRSRLERLLGVGFPNDRIAATLTALQMKVAAAADGWTVTPPPHRFEITIEADLIEEVARIIGFEAIPEADAVGPHQFRSMPEERPSEHVLLEALANRGYEETISFSFVDPVLQKRLFPDRPGLELANPIASDLSVMRVSLWPGLIHAALENQRRQQDRIRLFEHGANFIAAPGTHVTREVDCLAGIALGTRLPEQWGVTGKARVSVDFYDVKADIEALSIATGGSDSFVFEAPGNPLSCLHPGRAARILRFGHEVGWLGELHPLLVKELEFTYTPVLFELEIGSLNVRKPEYREISRFPQVRRDLAVVVDESVALSTLAERVTLSATSLLSELRIFDVYRGPGVETGRKSVALGLIFQDISRTLTDEDVEQLMASVVTDLRASVNARIRE